MFQKRRSRRGVVLLIVLSMLVLFTLMVVTFVVVTGQYRSAAVASAKYRRTGDDPRKFFDIALYQLLRDVPDSFDSSLRDQSLLGDLYGNDGLKARVTAGALSTGATSLSAVQNQFVVMAFAVPTSTGLPQPTQIEDYYNGRVLTMLGGDAAGQSTRVVDYYFHVGVDGEWGEPAVDDNGDGNDDINDAFMGANDDEYRIVVEAFSSDSGSSVIPTGGNWFVINGQPFNGTGYGYDPSTGNLDTDVYLPGPDGQWGDAGVDDDSNNITDDMSEAGVGDDIRLSGFAALMPHRSGPANSGRRGGNHALRRSAGPTAPAIRIDSGGNDESWDAVDFQNMYLAMVPPDFATYSEIIPSFARPALVNFVRVQLETILLTQGLLPPGTQLTPALFENPSSLPAAARAVVIQAKRACIFRPLLEDNPGFTGSNPSYNSHGNQFGGVWDVDNDGDGVRDSIWIDIGLPVKTAPDGRLYRPMVAILCKDMDGRLNLNAHDNNQHLLTTYQTYDSTAQRFNLASVTGSFAGATSATLSRGIGTGPAEVSLGPLFNSNSTEYTPVVQGRYLAPGFTNALPGTRDNADDDTDTFRNSDVPNDFYNGPRTAYASPPDSRGIGAIGLDATGHPLMYQMGQLNETQDDPYEFLLGYLTGTSSGDSPYTLAEQELLLRWFDIDGAQLPNRLARLGSNTFSSQPNRERVTVHSSHVPVPNASLPPETRATASSTSPISAGGTVLDLYRRRLQSGGCTTTKIRSELNKLVPFEMRQGQLFNINRRLGNGRDDNGDNVVDDPAERFSNESAWPGTTSTAFNSRRFNHRNDDPNQVADSRQIFARHLYCLMMLLVDSGYVHPFSDVDRSSLSMLQEKELTTRRIAQWAINVVDFRDPDSIMSPFEYDTDPFNGWDVDHWIDSSVGPGPDGRWGVANVDDDMNGTVDDFSEGGAPGSDDRSDNADAERGLVWGSEPPEILITETLAFHDRRVRNTGIDDDMQLLREDMPTNDGDLDQFRIPQGSLYFEFHNVRSPGGNNRPLLPRELYDVNGQMNLGYVHPNASSDGLRYPLWRVAISEQHSTGGPPRANSPASRVTAAPDSTSFEPPEMSLVSGTTAPLAISRLVWFANMNPAGRALAGATYYNSNGWNTLLDPGQSLVVGPRRTTYVGSVDDADPSTPWDGNSSQTIELSDTAIDAMDPQQHRVRVTDVNGNTVALPAGSTTVVGLAVDAAPPGSWTNAGRRIGLSISEPTPGSGVYYPEPNPTNDGRVPFDAYDDLMAPTNSLPDVPLDGETTVPPRPLEQYTDSTGTGTYTNFASAFLQRLANPLLPYDPTTNPYISVDWSTIDLTVFSGEENTNRRVMTPGGLEWVDPTDPNPYSTTTGARERFGTRSRGDAANNVSIWSPVAPSCGFTGASAVAGSVPYFAHNATQTLGYLGTNVTTPFPWITWNNRPFTNPAELMLVPASTPSRLLFEFSRATSDDPYLPYGDAADPDKEGERFRAPYEHLLNFFHGRGEDTVNAPGTKVQGANFFRLFDYIEAPSPFAGTDRWYNPEVFENANTQRAAGLRPPYNRLTRFRDPGRVNVNTIFDPLIWEGIAQGIPELVYRRGSDTKWGSGATTNPANMGSGDDVRFYTNKLAISRQGYGRQGNGTSYQQLAIRDDFPTRFANPFRSANASDLMPGAVSSMRLDGVHATTWRGDHSLDTATGLLTPGSSPLFDVARPDDEPYHSTDGNPYFRYQGFQKISNVLTTHSNVFAIWITVGFFEVELNPTGVDVAQPDGYRLTQELGTDTGEINRKRAFYLIDRSIPVGFEFGENHNVDRAILVRRLIE